MTDTLTNTSQAIKENIYYNRDGIVVRTSIKSDIDDLFWRLRKSDIDELWASHHSFPKDALKNGFRYSIICLTIIVDREVAAMFGIANESLLGDRATIWLLASPDLEHIGLRFLKHSREFINMFLEYYPILENWVDDRNKTSIEWLRFCGAKIDDPTPYGIEQMAFRHFCFERQ